MAACAVGCAVFLQQHRSTCISPRGSSFDNISLITSPSCFSTCPDPSPLPDRAICAVEISKPAGEGLERLGQPRQLPREPGAIHANNHGPSLAGASSAPQHPTNARRGGHGRATSIIARQPRGQPHTTCSAYRPAEVVILGLIAAVGPRAVASSYAADFIGSSGRLHLFLSKTAEMRDLEDKFEISGPGNRHMQTHSATILTSKRLEHRSFGATLDCQGYAPTPMQDCRDTKIRREPCACGYPLDASRQRRRGM